MNKRIAIFPGTFNPFTVGHSSIVERALPLFDGLVIAVGVNEDKMCDSSVQERLDTIAAYYADEDKVKVVCYSTLTVDLAKEFEAGYIVRGVRSVQDFEYERNLAEINRRLSGVETLLLYTLPEYAHISSSVVRELIKYGRDVSEMLPKK
ncbi:MAG: pantetheine-phosphate adenylyltransferase [Bacteroidales bacterium]